MANTRTILHLDMDAFFASVEQLDNPQLRGRPVLVGHDGPRGVVAAASYEARAWGCHSAQPMAIAKRKCPTAIVVPVRGGRYRELSDRVFSILEAFSPLIEPLSIDEAFIDASGTERLYGTGEVMARRIKQKIGSELHLSASVGVAPNKFLAKLASDLKKPGGLVVVKPQDIDTLLPPLPVTKIWGIGPVTVERLKEIGVRTIADLRASPMELLKGKLGDSAEGYLRLAHGIDDRPVCSDQQAKSTGQEQTFAQDLKDPEEVGRVLLEQAEQVGRRLRKHRLLARGVAVKIRFGDFQTVSRSMELGHTTDSTSVLWEAANQLFGRWVAEGYRPVRLIGMTAEQLRTTAGQLELFGGAERQKQRQVDQAVDRIVERFGGSAIRQGGGAGRSLD